MIWLSEELVFPSVNLAEPDGLLAMGGDLSLERLLLAYQNGIFPWYNADEPILWWSPNPRMVLFREELYISKSMQKLLRSGIFSVTYDTCFEQVIRNCGRIKRKGQSETWINENMIQAYLNLYQNQVAHSVEVWQNNELVGGLYGVQVGNVFCGESMFSCVSNASKYGFITFVKAFPDIKLIDCQIYSEHLASLGAREIPRMEFLKILKNQQKV